MSIYADLNVKNGQKELKWTYKDNHVAKKKTTFRYTNPIKNYFLYRHAVDGHVEATNITHKV